MPVVCAASKRGQKGFSARQAPLMMVARWWWGGPCGSLVAKHTSVAVLLLCVLCARASAFSKEEEEGWNVSLSSMGLLGVFLHPKTVIVRLHNHHRKDFISFESQSLRDL
jgi:hypothetical protein